MQSDLTPKQKKNLRRLATFLWRTRRQFTMSQFCEEKLGDATPVCGSIGCAVGNAPYAGIPKSVKESWYEYAERAFGGKSWSWCFSGGWAHFDNTSRGAAKRIFYMLEHGVPDAYYLKSHENVKIYEDVKLPKKKAKS